MQPQQLHFQPILDARPLPGPEESETLSGIRESHPCQIKWGCRVENLERQCVGSRYTLLLWPRETDPGRLALRWHLRSSQYFPAGLLRPGRYQKNGFGSSGLFFRLETSVQVSSPLAVRFPDS